jgi:hypothetical protein
MAKELVTMSTREVDRLGVIRKVLERRLTQVKAGELLGLGVRQVARLCTAYEEDGPAGLVSRKRGGTSNRRLPEELRSRVLQLVRERYSDFGPKLANEKLLELHGIQLAKETLRTWMSAAEIWVPRDRRLQRAHQPRHRRACLGELVQIDGSPHAWFEDRGPYCTLLVYVDDATGRVMELRFVNTESAFDYFASTVSYLGRHGKPVAFYSDKHSIFRVYQEGTAGRSRGVTQFGRALTELNIDIICANTAQAKGRVERMNQTLQDRLVKELRLQGICTLEGGNAFAPAFMADFNRRFGREPRNPHDAHRPLHRDENLSEIFTWQEERTMSRNLVVHFKRVTYLVEPGPDTLPLGGKRVRIHEWEDGRVEIHCEGRLLPCSVFDENPCVRQGDIVENKRLGGVLAAIQVAQAERDQTRLASKKLTLREKERIGVARAEAQPPPPPIVAAEAPPPPNQMGVFLTFLKDFEKEQKARTKASNDQSRRRREARAAVAGPGQPR